MYLADSNGKKSLTATLSIIAFAIVMLKLLLNGAAVQVSGFAYSFGVIDSMEVAAVLGPILGTYAFRRYTDSRFGPVPDPFYDGGGYGRAPYAEYSVVQEEIGPDVGSKPGDGRP